MRLGASVDARIESVHLKKNSRPFLAIQHGQAGILFTMIKNEIRNGGTETLNAEYQTPNAQSSVS
jgi:hypothetical protein